MFKNSLIIKNSQLEQSSSFIPEDTESHPTSPLKKNEVNFCLHCQNSLDTKRVKDFFCCNGCYSVYYFLKSHDLNKYYEIMKKVGEQPTQVQETSDTHFQLFRDENLNKIFKQNDNQWGFFVPEIKCAACIWLLEKVLSRLPNIKNVEVSLVNKTVSFSFVNEQTKSLEEVARLLINSGYDALPLPFLSSKNFRSQYEKERLKDIGISGFAFGNVMIFAASSYFGNHFGIERHLNQLFILLSMIVTVPTVIYAGRSFFINSYKALKNKIVHIDMTISFALIVTLAVSIFETFAQSGKVYYDTITGLIFLLLVGRYFHEKALHKASELGESIKNILPLEAYSIKKGDSFVVPIGKSFLADGIVIEGETEVNEASLTGEEFPVLKKVGDKVLAGSQNILRPVTIKAEKTGQETWISSLENLIKTAKSKKSHIESSLEKVLPAFTILTIAVSILAGSVWLFIDLNKALDVFVSILIISCPCALALATPLTMSQALRKLWEHGVIIKSSDAIESIAKIDTVLFDKTGTLTEGNLSVTEFNKLTDSKDILFDDEFILNAFAKTAQHSLHLVSRALFKRFFNEKNNCKIEKIEEIPGKGILANLLHKNKVYKIKIGNALFLGIQEDPNYNEFCVYGLFESVVFRFQLSQNIRQGAKEFIAYLHQKNIETYILSGDKKSSVKNIAKQLNFPENNYFSSLLPEEKLKILDTLQHQDKHVLAMGDGVNDAAMLAKAHVGIAAHGGVDIALHSSDIFLRKQEMDLIQKSFDFCNYVKKTLQILIGVSLFYNIVVVIFASLGLVNPLFAAVFMPVSSLSVYFIVLWRSGKHIWES